MMNENTVATTSVVRYHAGGDVCALCDAKSSTSTNLFAGRVLQFHWEHGRSKPKGSHGSTYNTYPRRIDFSPEVHKLFSLLAAACYVMMTVHVGRVSGY